MLLMIVISMSVTLQSVATEVLENKKNKVQIKIKESAKEHGIFTLTINGNALQRGAGLFRRWETD